MKEITIKQINVLRKTLDWLREKVIFTTLLILAFMLHSFNGFSQTYKDEIRQLKNLDYVSSGLTDDLIFINSNLQANNSAYSEGMSTLQRIIFENLPTAVGNEHTLRIRIQTLKGGKHAYDFITSWEQSMKVANTILPPGFVSLPDPGSALSHPSYNYVEYDDLACGPNITSTAEIACVAADVSGNQQFLPVVDDEVPNPNVDGNLDSSNRDAVIAAYEAVYGDRFVKVKGDMPFTGTPGDPNSRVTFAGFDGEYMFYDISWVSASSSIVIEFGAQIAAGFSPTGVYSKDAGYSIPADGIVGYGPGRGASDVSGAPYHVKFTAFLTDFVDGKAPTLGSQDNQLMADGVRLIPFCDLEGQQSFCLDEISGSVTYDGNATNLEGATYAWSFKTGTNTSNASFDGATDGPTVDVNPGNQEGGYTLVFRVTNDSGLFAECEIDVSISSPTATAGNGGPVCYDVTTIGLTESGGDAVSWKWTSNGAATFDNDELQNPTASGFVDGEIFTVNIVDSNGCTSSDTTTIQVDPEPTATAGNGGPVCYDVTTIGLTESGGDAVSWKWTSNGAATFDNDELQNPTASGFVDGEIFTVNIVDSNGCTSSDTTIITVNPEPNVTILDPPSDPVCSSDPGGISAGFQFIGQPLGGTWSGDVNADGTFNPDLSEATQKIRYDYTDGEGCSSYDEITFEFENQPNDDIYTDTLCVSDAGTVDIGSYVPAGATNIEYSGNGVDDAGNFTGNVAGIYVINITYNFAGNICRLGISLTITLEDCIVCETAFARDASSSQCFDQYSNLIPNDNRWGWTNYYAEAGNYSLDLYAGAGLCDITKGALVGEVNITDNQDGTIDVQFLADPNYVMSSVHLYVGCGPIPHKKQGNNYEYTVAPGQYPQNPNGNTGYVTDYTIEGIEVSGSFYVIAHVDICTSENPEVIEVVRSESLPVNTSLNRKFNTMQTCVNSSTKTASTTTSLAEASEPLFSVVPVPFYDVLNIGYLFEYTSDVTIQVFDLNGRLLATYYDTAVNLDSISSFSVDFRTKSNQIYIVRMTTDREVYTAKVVAGK